MFQILFLRRLPYDRQVRRFFMIVIALGFVIDGVYAVLLNLYLLRLGYDARFIGQVNSFGLLAFAAVSLPAGIMGARWSSGLMLRVGLAGTLLGTVLLPFAESSPAGWQEGWLIVSYALVLSGFSLFFVNASPFLMAVVERDRQNSAFATQTALLSMAAFIGSLFGGTLPVLIAGFYTLPLDDPQPYRYTLMLVAAVVLLAFAVTLTMAEQPADKEDEDTPAEQGGTERPVRDFTTAVLLIIGFMALVRFLQVAGLATTSVYFNVYLDTEFGMSSGAIGIIASLGRLVSVPVVLLAPRLIRRTSTGKVAVWASLVTALCLLPIALVPYWWAAAAGYVGALAVTNLRFTAFIVHILLLVPRKHQAIMAGAGETAAGFSFAFMALGGGYIATLFSFRELFLLGATLSGLGTVLFWMHLRGAKMREVPSPVT